MEPPNDDDDPQGLHGKAAAAPPPSRIRSVSDTQASEDVPPERSADARPPDAPNRQSQEKHGPDDRPALYDHRLEFRVAYQETDGQRRVHHANYLNYFEKGRVEMLRELGISYRDLEDSGILLVVTDIRLSYHAAAEFDDWLSLKTEAIEIRPVRLRHRYAITRSEPDGSQTLIVQGWSTVAAVNRQGKPCRLPKNLRRT
ncbi:MAG: thioesterase family protein [Planctomycetota bacterium]